MMTSDELADAIEPLVVLVERSKYLKWETLKQLRERADEHDVMACASPMMVIDTVLLGRVKMMDARLRWLQARIGYTAEISSDDVQDEMEWVLDYAMGNVGRGLDW